MEAPKAVETKYEGYHFRSRSEARWAIFLDACGVDWEYEVEHYENADGQGYVPDFLLHDVHVRNWKDGTDVWLEVKGNMTEHDREKIRGFALIKTGVSKYGWNEYNIVNPILVVGNIPRESTKNGWEGVDWAVFEKYDEDNMFYSFGLVDGDEYGAFPCITSNGKFGLIGGDYLEDADIGATELAFRIAREARFEWDETPTRASVLKRMQKECWEPRWNRRRS